MTRVYDAGRMMRDEESASFLSQAACRDLIARARRFARSGGDTTFAIRSTATGSLRWARNRVSAGSDTRDLRLTITRTADGMSAGYQLNQSDDASLRAAVESAEWFLQSQQPVPARSAHAYDAPHPRPAVFSDATYQLSPTARSDAAQPLMTLAEEAGMLSAGYIQVQAIGVMVDLGNGLERYYPYTTAEYTVTTRDARGTGSGWAGVDAFDWNRIDTVALSRVALAKCLASRDPVAIEPGRYTAILEPQAAADFARFVLNPPIFRRDRAEMSRGHPYGTPTQGLTKIGERMLDVRISITTDVMDPELGAVPFDWSGEPYLATRWFDRGVLTNIAYRHEYAVRRLGKNDPALNRGSFRMSGGTASLDDMIAGTERGVLITRFDGLTLVDASSLLLSGYTRDGLWLIERGRISKAIKNFRISESPLIALNNVEQLGVPVRVYSPEAPIVVPPLKVRDFSLVALADSV